MNEVTIHDGKTVSVDHPELQPHTETSGYMQVVPPPGTAINPPTTTITTTTNPAGVTIDMSGKYEPLWWMKTAPVVRSELYVRGTDYMLCATDAPVPNWFRRLCAKLAGFEWRAV